MQSITLLTVRLLAILVSTLLLISAPVALLVVGAIAPITQAFGLLSLRCVWLLPFTLATLKALPILVRLILLLPALLFQSLLFLILLDALAVLFPRLLLLGALLFLILLGALAVLFPALI